LLINDKLVSPSNPVPTYVVASPVGGFKIGEAISDLNPLPVNMVDPGTVPESVPTVGGAAGGYIGTSLGDSPSVDEDITGDVFTITTNLTSPVFSEFSDVAGVTITDGVVALQSVIPAGETRAVNARVMGAYANASYTIDRSFIVTGIAVVTPPVISATLYPGVAWNGTAGSGYVSAAPTRTGLAVNARSDLGWMHGTNAAIAQFVWPLPVDEMFTADEEVLISAWGANSSDGIVDGITSVTFFCEGRAVIVTAPTTRLIESRTSGGGTELRPAEVWVASLDFSEFSSDGAADVYATIQSQNVAIANRTIGPVRVFRKTGYDRTIDIAPGQAVVAGSRYQSAQAALSYLGANGINGEHVRLRWLENGFIDPSLIAFTDNRTATNSRRGQVVIDANGFDVIARRSTGSFTTFNPQHNGVVFKGVRFDAVNIQEITSDEATVNTGFRAVVLDGCEIYSSAGATELPNNTGASRSIGLVDSPYFLRRTWIHDVALSSLVSFGLFGCYLNTIGTDIIRSRGEYGVGSLYHSPIMFMCSGHNINENLLKAPLSAMTLAYAGVGTATYSISGSNGVSSRTLTLKVDGVTVGTFQASTTQGTGFYWVSDVVSSLNTALSSSGWTAMLGDNSRRFASIMGFSSTPGQTVTDAAIGIGVTLGTGFDAHVDIIQTAGTVAHENIILYGNRFVSIAAQTFFMAIDSGSAFNWAIIGNGSAPAEDTSLASQISGPHSHALFAHNSLVGQSLLIRRTTTNININVHSRFSANVSRTFSQDGAALGTFNAYVRGNIQTSTPGNALTGPNVVAPLIASDAQTANYPAIFTSGFTNEDFQPLDGGFVALNPVAKQTLFDTAGVVRTTNSIAGIYSQSRSLINFTLTSSSVNPTWNTVTVDSFTLTNAPVGSYIILVEGAGSTGDEAGFAVVNG
jgi:hypothetical protein